MRTSQRYHHTEAYVAVYAKPTHLYRHLTLLARQFGEEVERANEMPAPPDEKSRIFKWTYAENDDDWDGYFGRFTDNALKWISEDPNVCCYLQTVLRYRLRICSVRFTGGETILRLSLTIWNYHRLDPRFLGCPYVQ